MIYIKRVSINQALALAFIATLSWFFAFTGYVLINGFNLNIVLAFLLFIPFSHVLYLAFCWLFGLSNIFSARYIFAHSCFVLLISMVNIMSISSFFYIKFLIIIVPIVFYFFVISYEKKQKQNGIKLKVGDRKVLVSTAVFCVFFSVFVFINSGNTMMEILFIWFSFSFALFIFYMSSPWSKKLDA